jgi:hypothetical protein
MENEFKNKFEGTYTEFLDKITFTKPGFLKKPKGRKFYRVIWFDYDNKKDDKWFVYVSEHDMKGTKEEGYMITEQDIEHHFNFSYPDFEKFLGDE